MERSPSSIAGKYDARVSLDRGRLVKKYVATRFVSAFPINLLFKLLKYVLKKQNTFIPTSFSVWKKFFQKCQIRYISNDDHSKSLHVDVSRQNDSLYGKINAALVLCNEFCDLSSRHSRMQIANGEL